MNVLILPGSYEAYVPTKEAQASEDPRLPCPDEHQGWSRSHSPPPSQGPQAARCLTMSGNGPGSPRRRRLSRSGDFKRAYKEGSSKATRHLVLYRFERSADDNSEIRLGVSVSKRLGDAVTRNRVKRVLKEAFWSQVDPQRSDQDFVLVARPGIGEVIEKDGLSGAEECVREVLGKESEGKRST